jgi:Fe2+ transport system protein FeoA
LKTIFKKAPAVYLAPVPSLAEIPRGRSATVREVAGPRAFRRRLLEMGLIPGTEVKVVTVAPLGDPLRIEVRGGEWSIRRAEAAQIAVETGASAPGAAKSPA